MVGLHKVPDGAPEWVPSNARPVAATNPLRAGRTPPAIPLNPAALPLNPAALPLNPTALPLNDDEAELCDRLRDVLAKPAKRVAVAVRVAPDVGIRPAATPLEPLPEPAPVVPYTPLPPTSEDEDTGPDTGPVTGPAPVARWMQRRRRHRLMGAVRASGAWFITFGVVGLTSLVAMVAALGVDKTVNLARVAGDRWPAALAQAAMAVRAAVGL